MILVSVGTNEQAFDRLVEAAGAVAGHEEMVVQHGPSAVRPPGAVCRDFIPFDELRRLARRARVVVTHAGVGSVMLGLAAGRRPVVMCRRHDLGEAVDDHQVPFARRLETAGLVQVVDSAAALRRALAGGAPAPASIGAADPRLVASLQHFLHEAACATAP